MFTVTVFHVHKAVATQNQYRENKSKLSRLPFLLKAKVLRQVTRHRCGRIVPNVSAERVFSTFWVELEVEYPRALKLTTRKDIHLCKKICSNEKYCNGSINYFLFSAKFRAWRMMTCLVYATEASQNDTQRITLNTALTLILRRSRTGTVWFYTSISNKRAARLKLYTESLTGDLKLMYSRLTLVRISIKL